MKIIHNNETITGENIYSCERQIFFVSLIKSTEAWKKKRNITI